MHDTIFKKPKLIVFGNHYIGICEYKKKKRKDTQQSLTLVTSIKETDWERGFIKLFLVYVCII